MSKPFNSTGALTLDSELTFGKFQGYSVYEAISEDPAYVGWLYVEASKPMNEETKKMLVSRLLELVPKQKSKPTHFDNSGWDDEIPF